MVYLIHIKTEEVEKLDISKNNSIKKKLFIIISIILGAIILMFGALLIIDKFMSEDDTDAPIDYNFYPADYDENIFLDEEYMELIKNGYLNYTSDGVTYGIEPEQAVDYGKDVEFMCDLVHSIIYGDSEEYNKHFSSLYFESKAPKGKFTMQKLYDVDIVKDYELRADDGEYTVYRYKLTYNIFQNNGTYRNDIGDGRKTQYITITDREGKLLIDSVTTAKIIVQK